MLENTKKTFLRFFKYEKKRKHHEAKIKIKAIKQYSNGIVNLKATNVENKKTIDKPIRGRRNMNYYPCIKMFSMLNNSQQFININFSLI